MFPFSKILVACFSRDQIGLLIGLKNIPVMGNGKTHRVNRTWGSFAKEKDLNHSVRYLCDTQIWKFMLRIVACSIKLSQLRVGQRVVLSAALQIALRAQERRDQCGTRYRGRNARAPWLGATVSLFQ